MSTENDLINEVKDQLRKRRGEWRQISDRSGVPYFTLAKIASGATSNPRWRTLSRLSEELQRNTAA
jgi:predicted transcriptional regulator